MILESYVLAYMYFLSFFCFRRMIWPSVHDAVPSSSGSASSKQEQLVSTYIKLGLEIRSNQGINGTFNFMDCLKLLHDIFSWNIFDYSLTAKKEHDIICLFNATACMKYVLSTKSLLILLLYTWVIRVYFYAIACIFICKEDVYGEYQGSS